MQTQQKQQAFTLIELMIVIAIMGVMAAMAAPTYQDFVIRSQVSEALQMSESIQKSVIEYYHEKKQFPADNNAAGLSAPQHLIGNYVTAVQVRNGAVHVTFGHRINAHVQGKVLSLRPAYVSAHPANPPSWLCGYAEPVPGMDAAGENLTDVPAMYLSPACRSWRSESG